MTTDIQSVVQLLTEKDLESLLLLEKTILSRGIEAFNVDNLNEDDKKIKAILNKIGLKSNIYKYLQYLDSAFKLRTEFLSHLENKNVIEIYLEDNNRKEQEISQLIDQIKLLDMNSKPWKYATHCLKADPYNSIFICKENQPQLLYIDGEWQLSEVYFGILKEIEIEYHPNIDKECNLISRKDIRYYQNLLDTQGLSSLDSEFTNLCNSNSMGAVPHIVAIRVVLFNNDLTL